MDKFLFYRTRIVLAAYFSVVAHISFIVYASNSSPDLNGQYICAPLWMYPTQPEGITEEYTFKMEFSDEQGDGEGSIEFSMDGEDGDSGNPGEFGEMPTNPEFDKSKFGEGQWKDLVEKLEESSNLRKNFKNSYDNIVKDGSVPDSYIYRNREYEDITVKEVFPTIHNIDKPFEEEIRQAPADLVTHQERNKIIDLYRNKTDEGDVIQINVESDGEKTNKSVLEMPKQDRMTYLDQSITKKKEIQMKEFISRFMNYDPDKGDLPNFVRDLYYENLQRLAYPFSSDPTYFSIDYFQENLNKEDFLKHSLALYSEFQENKVGTEILFTLENIYDIQSRALAEYFKNAALLSSLSPEQKKQLRVEVIRRVLEKYKPILKEKNIKSMEDVNRLYTQKKLEIMDTILKNTPDNYRRSDAVFEKGRIHWEYSQTLPPEKRIDHQNAAIQLWKSLRLGQSNSGDFLNSTALEDVMGVLNSSSVNALGMIDFNSQNHISFILRNRISKQLNEKKIREDKLLWKKNEAKQLQEKK
ncbi:hypothetical protein [Leptospira sp. GIMC2001]|uniref:hypothetical protein n=1 Tax=Leptospira sp. GIMC2001 TaxID=1513297 RepID=UPI0023494A72|nr:hypothetical protein [Leptospira sp. GIMC2001]WCL50351.1 hypothetical protein O4O04_05910 [Leptospira sp. GIMC2001]